MNCRTSASDEYVGFKSPPKHSRFKMGNREHLKRRKRQMGDFASDAQSVLETRTSYRDGHKLKRGRRIDVSLKRLKSAALKGDLEAIAQLMDLRQNSKLSVLEKPIMYITEQESRY
jgi:hypothetical protein